MLGDVVGAERDRDHGAGCRRVHQAGPLGHHLDRGRQVEYPGQSGSGVFTDAVSGHRPGAHAVAFDQLAQRVFHCEQGGLGPIGTFQAVLRPKHRRTGWRAGRYPTRRGIPRRRRRTAGRRPARCRRARAPCRGAGRPGRGTGRRPDRRLSALTLADSPTKTLSCSAARNTVTACSRSCTTAAVRAVVLAPIRERGGDVAQVGQLSAGVGERGGQIERALPAPQRFSPTAAGPGGRAARHGTQPAAPLRRRRARWCRPRRTS